MEEGKSVSLVKLVSLTFFHLKLHASKFGMLEITIRHTNVVVDISNGCISHWNVLSNGSLISTNKRTFNIITFIFQVKSTSISSQQLTSNTLMSVHQSYKDIHSFNIISLKIFISMNCVMNDSQIFLHGL